MPLLKFYKISSAAQASDYLAADINRHLLKGAVIWLLSGGSSIPVEAAASRKLSGNLSNLTVTLADERFGPLGHPDSNWLQLKKAGFKAAGAKLQPVLSGANFEDTISRYNRILNEALVSNGYKIGVLGVGPDNHIAGIKPRSPAAAAQSLAIGYKWEDYARLTMTFAAIEKLDCAIVYMVGEAKRQAIENLKLNNTGLNEQPSQILKRVKRVIILNDQYDSLHSSSANSQ